MVRSSKARSSVRSPFVVSVDHTRCWATICCNRKCRLLWIYFFGPAVDRGGGGTGIVEPAKGISQSCYEASFKVTIVFGILSAISFTPCVIWNNKEGAWAKLVSVTVAISKIARHMVLFWIYNLESVAGLFGSAADAAIPELTVEAYSQATTASGSEDGVGVPVGARFSFAAHVVPRRSAVPPMRTPEPELAISLIDTGSSHDTVPRWVPPKPPPNSCTRTHSRYVPLRYCNGAYCDAFLTLFQMMLEVPNTQPSPVWETLLQCDPFRLATIQPGRLQKGSSERCTTCWPI